MTGLLMGKSARISTDGFSAVIANRLSGACLIKANVSFDETLSRCGIFLRGNSQLDKAYYITLNKQENAIEFASHLFQDDQGWRFIPHHIDLQRPYIFKSNTVYELKVISYESICLVYFNDELALSARTYDLNEGNFGFFTVGGEVAFHDIEVLALN